MKETIRNVRIADIPQAIQQLGLPEDTTVALTIEQQECTHVERDLSRLMGVVEQVRKRAREEGSTDEKLEQLLLDES